MAAWMPEPMLFNSYEFIFIFLPVVAFLYFYIGKKAGSTLAFTWLVLASMFFYGWWNPVYLNLILLSVVFNYAVGVMLGRHKGRHIDLLLAIGIAVNLTLLGYYKYANFFVDNFNDFSGSDYHLTKIALPLAISFFTFQQIAYLVDAYRGETREYNFLHYFLFVTFFPQLIAGPIVHHKEMLPQFSRPGANRFRYKNLVIGFTIFAIGLFKKTVVADGISGYSTPVFSAASAGFSVTFFEAWSGALAYSFQLYFDFSGYSDMAIGIARIFNIRLPINFDSPYKAVNIIEFWRRWHITLSRFLRDYLYIPLGGNRKGPYRRHANLLITMLLGGFWHGAGWTFIIWGGLHGVYLIVNHFYSAWKHSVWPQRRAGGIHRFLARFLTFLLVVVAWVFFRADNVASAMEILRGMTGLNGVYLGNHWQSTLGPIANTFSDLGIVFDGSYMQTSFDKWNVFWIAVVWLAAWTFPNTQQLMGAYRPALNYVRERNLSSFSRMLRWRPTLQWSGIVVIMMVLSFLTLSRVSEFLYFQF